MCPAQQRLPRAAPGTPPCRCCPTQTRCSAPARNSQFPIRPCPPAATPPAPPPAAPAPSPPPPAGAPAHRPAARRARAYQSPAAVLALLFPWRGTVAGSPALPDGAGIARDCSVVRAAGMDAKPDADAARPTGQQETARTIRVEVTPRSVVTVVAVLIGWWLLAQVWEVVLTLTFAMILAGTLSPVIDWLAARRLPRPLALLAVIAGVLAALGGLVALVAPAFGAQARALIDSAPLMQQRLADFVAGTPLGGQVDGLRQTTLDQVSLLLPGTLPLAGRAFEAVAL